MRSVTTPTDAKVPIVGVGSDGLAGMTARSRELLMNADLLLGSEAVLKLVPEPTGERQRIGSDLHITLETIRANLGKRRMVIVAGGDPLFYGVARYLCDRLGKETFEVVPHVSSMQLAFARIKETWEEAYLTDLSARPLETVIDRIRTSETVGLFSSDAYPPGRVARELLARGIDYFRAYVCENLGGPDERVTRGPLEEIAGQSFDPLNVMILVRQAGRPDAPRKASVLRRFGNPDETFATSRTRRSEERLAEAPVTSAGALITQAEVRAIALAQLALQPGMTVWDVGAGSGSVALEAAQLAAPGAVYAIEQDPADYQLLVGNVETYAVANVRPVFGSAPAALDNLPAPDAVFVGGTGREVGRLLEACLAAMRPGGQLVANVATLESVGSVYASLKQLAGPVEVLLVNIARGVEQLETLRFEAVNPTFILTVTKPQDT
jgi:precorrin-6Y C5,15-methyltransferase (decarboxylating)